MKCLFAAAFSFFLLTVTAQKKTDPAKLFNDYVATAVPQWKVPGLSVAVVKNGKVAFLKGYGVAEIGKPEPFTSSTVSICASTTKAMTAVCMAMLVDEGKVQWNDKVSDVYPPLKLKDPVVTSEITIRDLFTHNAGLGNADLLWIKRLPVDSIIYRMRYIEPAYSLRSSFVYQNLMYIVAGEVIHRLSGKPWQDFIMERLFRPIGMTHTYAVYSQMKPAEKTTSLHYFYPDSVVRKISYKPHEVVGAAGSVWSNAEDMSKWMLFLLDSTKVGGKPLLKAETYAEIFRPQVMGDPYPTAQLVKHHWDTYGLGWFQHDFKGRMLQYHTGSLGGATAIIGLVPEENMGVYVFGNLDHAELRHALLYKAIDLFCFNDNSRDYSKEFLALYTGFEKQAATRRAKEDSNRVTDTHPTLSLKEYTGIYENELYGAITVSQKNDTLHFILHDDLKFTLEHWHYDTFKTRPSGNWIPPNEVLFSLNADAKAEQLLFLGSAFRKRQ